MKYSKNYANKYYFFKKIQPFLKESICNCHIAIAAAACFRPIEKLAMKKNIDRNTHAGVHSLPPLPDALPLSLLPLHACPCPRLCLDKKENVCSTPQFFERKKSRECLSFYFLAFVKLLQRWRWTASYFFVQFYLFF